MKTREDQCKKKKENKTPKTTTFSFFLYLFDEAVTLPMAKSFTLVLTTLIPRSLEAFSSRTRDLHTSGLVGSTTVVQKIYKHNMN